MPGVKWCYDLNNVPWPYDDESTQTVLAIDVIEHLDNPKSILEEIYRILIPGGLLQLQVPYFGSLAHANDMTHKHGFTPSTFGFSYLVIHTVNPLHGIRVLDSQCHH